MTLSVSVQRVECFSAPDVLDLASVDDEWMTEPLSTRPGKRQILLRVRQQLLIQVNLTFGRDQEPETSSGLRNH